MAQINQKVVALHTVTRAVTPGKAKTKDSPAVRPQTEEIAPGTIFVVTDSEELDFLVGSHAVSTTIPKAAFAMAPAAVVDGPGDREAARQSKAAEDAVTLSDADRADWIERGKKVGVNVGDNWKAATIVKKVEEAEAESKARAASDAGQTGGDGSDLV
jgi:hypothetical protein